MALGILQVIEGCMFLMTFFGSPIGLIKIAFGLALALVALFGAVITDGRILHYLDVYLARPILEIIKEPFAGNSASSNPISGVLQNIDSPWLLGMGTILLSILTGSLEACGEALAVLAVVPIGLSIGMIVLSLLPFISVFLLDLFLTSLLWLPALSALAIVLFIHVLYSKGGCTIMR